MRGGEKVRGEERKGEGRRGRERGGGKGGGEGGGERDEHYILCLYIRSSTQVIR